MRNPIPIHVLGNAILLLLCRSLAVDAFIFGSTVGWGRDGNLHFCRRYNNEDFQVRPKLNFQLQLQLSNSNSNSNSNDGNNGNSNNNGVTTVNDFSRDSDFQKRSNRWILIVDDEESIRQAVGQLLFDQGFQVTACADAATALQIAQEPRQQQQTEGDDSNNSSINNQRRYPDVIVSDINMPEMNGLELLARIRSDEQLQGIPVVLLTAKGMTQDRITGYDAGADAYLPKPFDPEELVSICDGLIQQYEVLNGNDLGVDDLQQDLDEIKQLLLENGGGGIGNGWVDMGSNVFLAPDERHVLELLCEGLMNKEIAAKTFLSKRRVEQLLTSMYRKVDAKNRTELVRWAVSSGNVQI